MSNAVIEGLPPGIAAKEVLVDNGSQSFSVIMSATPDDLAHMLKLFISTIGSTPPDGNHTLMARFHRRVERTVVDRSKTRP